VTCCSVCIRFLPKNIAELEQVGLLKRACTNSFYVFAGAADGPMARCHTHIAQQAIVVVFVVHMLGDTRQHVLCGLREGASLFMSGMHSMGDLVHSELLGHSLGSMYVHSVASLADVSSEGFSRISCADPRSTQPAPHIHCTDGDKCDMVKNMLLESTSAWQSLFTTSAVASAVVPRSRLSLASLDEMTPCSNAFLGVFLSDQNIAARRPLWADTTRSFAASAGDHFNLLASHAWD